MLACLPCALWPVTTGGISYGQERFPDLGRAVFDTIGHHGPCFI